MPQANSTQSRPRADLAAGVVEHLAVLAGDDRGEVVAACVEQLAQAEHAGAPPAERRRAPVRGGHGRDLHRVVDLGGRGERDLGGLHAAGRVEDRRAPRRAVPSTRRPPIQCPIVSMSIS